MLAYLKLIAESELSLSPIQFRAVKIGILAGSAVLAWLTWRFVETPIRYARIPQSLKAQGLVVAMIVTGLAGIFATTEFAHTRLDQPSLARILPAIADYEYMQQGNSITSIVSAADSGVEQFKVISRSNRVTLFVGDSHVREYRARVENEIRRNPGLASGLFVIRGGCPPLPGLNRDQPGYQCSQFYDYWTMQAKAKNVSSVVIGGYWEAYIFGKPAGYSPGEKLRILNISRREAERPDFEAVWQGLEATVASLTRSGKRVYILSSTPASPTFDPRGVVHRLSGDADLQPIKKADFNSYIAPIEARLLKVTSSTGATLIRPTDYFCDGSLCPATDRDWSPLYADADHLRPASIVERATFINKVLQP